MTNFRTMCQSNSVQIEHTWAKFFAFQFLEVSLPSLWMFSQTCLLNPQIILVGAGHLTTSPKLTGSRPRLNLSGPPSFKCPAGG